MKVKVIRKYYDTKLEDYMSIGRVLEVEEERATVLEAAGVGKRIDEPKEKSEESAIEPEEAEKKQESRAPKGRNKQKENSENKK